MGQKATQGIEAFGDASDANHAGKKLDLSVAQVAGTSLATVAAALLASKLGVYGTILGAGVVSVVATAGGPLIQHFFRRTGDQLRETARPRARQAPLPGESDGEFGAATVHGTRVRGWKRTAVASGAAFAIAIGGLGAYEAAAGTSVSKDGGTIFSGGTRKAPDARPDSGPGAPERERQERQGPGERNGDGDGKGGATPGSGGSPSPSPSPGDRSPGSGPSPSGSGEPPAPPKPDPSTPAPSQDPNPDPGRKPDPDPKPTPTPPGSAPAPASRSSP